MVAWSGNDGDWCGRWGFADWMPRAGSAGLDMVSMFR